MASKHDPYITKRINARTGKRRIERLIRKGWEQLPADVSGGHRVSRQVILRYPNPKYVGKDTHRG